VDGTNYFYELLKAYQTLAELGKEMYWRTDKYCLDCGRTPDLEGKLVSNPTLEIYVCGSCGKRFLFDTWTKAVKEDATDAGRKLQL
jgi:hypothetical protein